MQFSDYLLKRLSSAQQVGQSNTTNNTAKLDAAAIKNASLFSSLSAEDLAKIDFEQLLATGVGTDDEALNNVLKSFLELEGIQQAADGDTNGEMSAEEAQAFIQSILGKDGDAENISMEDLDAVIQELGIDLDSVAASLDEVLNEEKEEEVKPEEAKAEKTEKEEAADETETAKNAEKTTAPKSTGGTGSTGSSGVNNGGGTTGTTNNTKKTEESKGETPEEIKKDIETKNGEIEQIESDAEKQVEEQEKAKEKAMKQYGVSEEEYQKYQEEEKKIDNQIKDKDNELKEQDAVISDAEATISSNESYISDLDNQIAANKDILSQATEKDGENSQKSDIQAKISNLEQEKKAKEDENKKLKNETIKNAEEAKTRIEEEKAQLEQDKQELLEKTLGESKGFCSGLPSSARDGIKNQIMQYDDKIKEINDKKTQDVAGVQKEITTLEAKLKTAEEKEKRNEFLKENSALKGGQSVVDFATQFDGKSSSEMYQIMRDAGYRVDEGYWCADFVNFALGSTIGKENLPDWYNNCNTASCSEVANAAKGAGAVIDQSQVKPGDVVLFSKDGGNSYYHTGIVTSIDDDGTLHTMEGNTWTSNENWGAWKRSYNMNNGKTYTFVSMS